MRVRAASFVAFLIIATTVAFTIRHSGYVAGMTDPSAYVSAGRRWLDRDLFHPAHIQLLPQWPHPTELGSPLGYRAGAITGTDVVEYAPGYSIFIAATMRIGGELGAYLVGPLFLAVLGAVTYALGARLAGGLAGTLSALLITINPITILHSLHPMSDVAAGALFVLSWLMSLRSGGGAAAAAGAAIAATVMVRPNLAPLALVPATIIATSPCSWRERLRWIVVFGATASIGPLIVLWSQAVLYGSAFTPGYKGYRTFFALAHIRQNLSLYPQWLIELHTPLIFAAFAAFLFVWRAGPSISRDTRVIALSGVGVIAINYALYLPYLNFAEWTYLRFLLPALVAVYMLFAALVVHLVAVTVRLWKPLAFFPVLLVAVLLWPTAAKTRTAFNDSAMQQRIRLMGRYLHAALPANAVILTYMHSGAVAYYTGRPIVRLDLMPPPQLDASVDRLFLERRRPVIILDEMLEARGFGVLFEGSRFQRLDWPPRAEFISGSSIWLMDPADRDPYRRGARWPIDSLKATSPR